MFNKDVRARWLIVAILTGLLFTGCAFAQDEPQAVALETEEQAQPDESEAASPTPLPPPSATATLEPSPTPTQIPTNTPTPTPTLTPTPTPAGGGGVIAFSSIRLGSEYDSPEYDIFLLNPEGSDPEIMTLGQIAINISPAWSPQGDHMIYSGDENLILLEMEGQDRSPVEAPFGSGVYHPAWAPNDEFLVSYATTRAYPQFWVGNADSEEWTSITPDISFQFGPVISPDGQWVAFAGSPGTIFSEWFEFFFGGFRLTAYDVPPREIYLLNLESHEMVQISDDPEDDFDPAWSPDGSRLAFVSTRDGNPEIYSMNIDGSEVTRLTQNDDADIHPNWSPDGLQMAFSSDRDGNFEIYRMAADGSDPFRLTFSLLDDLEPNWSPVNPLLVGMVPPGPVTAEIGQDGMRRAVRSLADTGLLSTAAGEYYRLPDYSEKLAKINYLQWSRTGYFPANFVIRTNASWDSASDKANWFNSGCGFVFRETDPNNFYFIHLGLDGITYGNRLRNRQWGTQYRGTKVPLDIPAGDAQLMLVVDGDRVMFFVNGMLVYNRIDNGPQEGGLGLTLVSGTNKGYGTSCDMRDIDLWILEE